MKVLRRNFLQSDFKENAILGTVFNSVSDWSFCRDILHGSQMSTCYQYKYPEVFHIYCWKWSFRLC